MEAGNARVAALVPKAGAEEVWRMLSASARTAPTDAQDDPWVRRAALLDLDAVEAAERRGGMRFVIPGDAEWPARFADLVSCPPVQDMGGVPIGLWVRGSVPFADAVASSVAIVGSRASTPYGDRVASGLAADLASVGIAVVSGGAYGIDAAAHRGALSEGGPTVAFLAGGVDEPYPRMNAGLLEEVALHGALVSEYPPGAHPTRPRFLARNRLIAAASEGTVMVEAAARSGARNTVTWAGGCFRPVMAVPGPIGNSTSFTPHRLIRTGEAVLVTCADEVRELIRPLGSVQEWRPSSERLLDTLTDQQRAAYEALPSRGVRDVGDLAVRSGLRMPECLAALDVLATIGLAVRHNDGRWGLGKVGDRPMLPFETTARAAELP